MASADANPSVQSEKINTDIVTLTRFLTEEQVKHKEATGDFTYVSLFCDPSHSSEPSELNCPSLLPTLRRISS